MENSKLILNKTRLTQLQDDQLDGMVGGILDIDVDANSCKKNSCNGSSAPSDDVAGA